MLTSIPQKKDIHLPGCPFGKYYQSVRFVIHIISCRQEKCFILQPTLKDLKEPVEVIKLFGIKKRASAILFYTDEPEKLLANINEYRSLLNR